MNFHKDWKAGVLWVKEFNFMFAFTTKPYEFKQK